MEFETMLLGCQNLRNAYLYAAFDTAGRSWWNAFPGIAHMGYADLREQVIRRWCQTQSCTCIYKPSYMKKREQRNKESVREFSECFLVLLHQLNPKPTENAAITMFNDKLHKEISAVLAGDIFQTLQEAIDKAQTVEKKSQHQHSIPWKLQQAKFLKMM